MVKDIIFCLGMPLRTATLTGKEIAQCPVCSAACMAGFLAQRTKTVGTLNSGDISEQGGQLLDCGIYSNMSGITRP